ncbi:hypothetical protein [Cylindrospermum sp. FACHB-282]|uniref:hypothetical protein n=1 Tax=Cylindrospermum sp. FACHB-282 TaxID=2692794 RepID=UPI00168210FD|nr:hypothetical protein [Cylindrospermum sp. FACHB-282]MBD2386674.1 hypothetical protein [Cylindrospermum sp. FACHB-282]
MQLKHRFLPIWIGTASLIISLGVTIAYAQSPNEPLPNKPITAGAPFGKPPQEFPELANINLTQEQKEKIQQIQREIMPQIGGILPRPDLTPEQKKQFESGQPVQVTLTPPTSEQKAKLEKLIQTYRERVAEILTPQQRQQFEQNYQDVIKQRGELK